MAFFFYVLIEKFTIFKYNKIMENELKENVFDENYLLKRKESINNRRIEIGKKLSQMTEEELAKYIEKSLNESIEFAKNNNIETIEDEG